MSVATDDVHDLFDSGDDDGSDDPGPAPDERADESGGSTESAEFPSLEDEGSVASADPARDETAESTTVSSAEAVGDDADLESTESGTMSFDGSVEGGTDGFELGASTTHSDGSDQDAADASDSPTSPPMPSEETAEDDADGSEPTTTPAGEALEADAGEDDAGELELAVSSASADGSVEDDADELESAASTTSPSAGGAEDATGESGSTAATTPPGETVAEERDDSGPGRATTSADGTTADDQGEAESGGTTTSAGGSSAGGSSTDRPTVDGHDEFETASPDEAESVASETAVAAGMAVDGRAAGASGSNRLPTGIDELDRAMGGGVPPGRLVVLVADPGVQSELIVDSVLAQRDTLFVTTDRPDWEVMKDIEPGLGSGEVVIRDHTPDSLLSGLDSLLDELGTSSNFVIDSVNELELLPRKRYRIFLSDVKRRLFDTGSVGLFTGVTVGHESARDLTLRRADVVWRLETRTADREIENRLSVPKFRGGAALTETVRLELTDEVRVDPTWNDG